MLPRCIFFNSYIMNVMHHGSRVHISFPIDFLKISVFLSFSLSLSLYTVVHHEFHASRIFFVQYSLHSPMHGWTSFIGAHRYTSTLIKGCIPLYSSCVFSCDLHVLLRIFQIDNETRWFREIFLFYFFSVHLCGLCFIDLSWDLSAFTACSTNQFQFL